MIEFPPRAEHCPFCSLLCELGDVARPQGDWNVLSCAKRLAGQRQAAELRRASEQHATGERSPTSVGDFVTARDWLQSAERVLVTGRIHSVEVSRRVVEIARSLRGTLDRWDSDVSFDTFKAIQTHGAYMTSLAEARDRSDLLLVIGDDSLLESAPGLPESLSRSGIEDSQGGEQARSASVLLLGAWGETGIARWEQAGFRVTAIASQLDKLPRMLSLAVREGERQGATSEVSRLLLEAKYTTVVWSPKDLTVSHRDLWISEMMRWILKRNETDRIGALVWNDFGATFHQVCTWTTGYPGRVCFNTEVANYRPSEYSAKRWLERNRRSGSLVLWVDETLGDLPVELARSGVRTIAVGSSGLVAQRHGLESSGQELGGESSSKWLRWIPAGVVGVDYVGSMFRGDQTVLARVHPESKETVSGVGHRESLVDCLGRLVAR